jgi:hypothetical protein
MWVWRSRPVAAPRHPSARVLILARALHPAFSDELAERLVACLPRRELAQLWDETTKLLGQPIPDEVVLNVVLLRDQLLRRLERVHPRGLEDCFRTGRLSADERPRSARR